MNSLVSIAWIYIIEESKTFIFTRGTSTYISIFNITGIWINNHTFPYIIRISHCSIERSHDTENTGIRACSPCKYEGFTLFNYVNPSNIHQAIHKTNLSGWSALCWLKPFPHYISGKSDPAVRLPLMSRSGLPIQPSKSVQYFRSYT
jgi:hypothetical protein